MAKLSMINRELKRFKAVQKYADKRSDLKDIIRNPNTSEADKQQALAQLQAMPRDASPVRLQRRCRLTGRPHSVYRKFGLGRNKLREAAMRGDIPGLRKASW